MTNQLPSSNYVNSMDAGNIIVRVYQGYFSTFAAAIAAKDSFKKVGVLSGGAQMEISGDKIDFFSGVPQVLVQRIQTLQSLKVSGAMAEFTPINLALALGMIQSDLTVAVKSSSPTATTVATGSTQSVIKVASATGFEANRLIKVGTGSNAQYGVIKSISGTDFTMYDGLSGSTNPTTGYAVAEVDTTKLNIGAVAAPQNIAIRLTKQIVTGVDAYDVYILKAQADPNVTINWSDGGGGGGGVDPISIPFAWDALGDPDVESGNLAQIVFTQS